MRGGPMGMRGGFHPGMRGRGILRGIPPRGMGFHHRGGPPRGGGGPPNGRGRPPMYNNQGYHHQGYPPPNHNSVPPQQSQPPAQTDSISTTPTTSSAAITSTAATVSQTTSTTSPPTNGVSSGTPQSVSTTGIHPSRGTIRGRGAPGMSRGGRGGYTPNINVSGNDMSSSGPLPPKPYRGGPPRGRGGYNPGLPRPPPVIQPGMTQGAPVPALKRGPPMGIPGPKRGRYEQGPPSRPYAPKYPSYSQQQVPTHPPQHNNYHNPSQTQRY